jgi:hypothetical protein
MLSKRKFLLGLGSGLLVAPSIVRASSLMQLRGDPLRPPTEYRDYLIRSGKNHYEVWRRVFGPDVMHTNRAGEKFFIASGDVIESISTDVESVHKALASPYTYVNPFFGLPGGHHQGHVFGSVPMTDGGEIVARWKQLDKSMGEQAPDPQGWFSILDQRWPIS